MYSSTSFSYVPSHILDHLTTQLYHQGLTLRQKWQSHFAFSTECHLDDDFFLKATKQPSIPKSDSPEAPGSPKPRFRRRVEPEYNVFDRAVPPKCSRYSFRMNRGVVRVFDSENPSNNSPIASTDDVRNEHCSQSLSPLSSTRWRIRSQEEEGTGIDDEQSCFAVPSFSEYVKDLWYIKKACFTGSVASYAFNRLELLSAKFHLHILLNGDHENASQKSVPHRDFYNVRKVDTHVHHSASMNQKHLLRFIKHKLKFSPEEVVAFRDGRYLTLGEVFKSLGLTAYDLSIDTLDMHANDTFHRFDKFNLKYNPAGQSRLREIFLKTDNLIQGKYLAEITQEMFNDLEASKYQLVEWRISIYGKYLLLFINNCT